VREQTLPGFDAGLPPGAVRPGTAAQEAGYEIEQQLAAAGALRIAGVDEVGRGAWAGPVIVCAAITDLSAPPELPRTNGKPVRLTDSKLLTARHREAFTQVLPGWLVSYAFGAAGPEEIDEFGMTKALRRAAVRALQTLPQRPDAVLLDGDHDYIGGSWRVRCEIKADQRSVSVAAASVLAKVHRDRLMAGLAPRHPRFGFEGNAGYPSPVHQKALAELGPTRHHRLSWSYLDDLPQWKHLKKYRDPLTGEGQLTLL
jgi:ribonuclease HII